MISERDKIIELKANKYNISNSILQDWKSQQSELKKQLILSDTEEWQETRKIFQSCSQDEGEKNEISSLDTENNTVLKYVGGVDISYNKDSEHEACVACVVCRFPDLKVVYEDMKLINITTPYVPDFLAFREVPYLEEAIKKLKITHPQYMPQIILVDGNGCLHTNGFGAACHLGVLLDIPCIGAAKNMYYCDNIDKDYYKNMMCSLEKEGDYFPVCGATEQQSGIALKTTKSSKKPIIVSIGHRCSLETAIWLVMQCCRYRVPEPTRQADIKSREFLRLHLQKKNEKK